MKIFKLLILFFISSLVVTSPVSANQDITIKDIHNFISTTPTLQEVEGAIVKLKNLVAEDSSNYVTYEMLALLYEYTKQYDEALKELLLAAKYFPQNSSEGDIFYSNLARAYINLARFDEAKPVIDKALICNPDNLFNRMHLLSYYIAKDMYKEAARELKAMSGLNKEKDYYYHFYVYSSGSLHKAGPNVIKLFQEGVKANPKNNMAHRVLAIALRDYSTNIKKDFPRVIAELNKALKLNQKYLYTYISFGDTYMFMSLETGKKAYLKKSLRWFNRAYKLEPKNVKLAYAMGHFFVNTGKYDKAIDKFEYVRANGDSSEAVIDGLVCAYNNKADAYYKTGENLDQGLETIDKALKLRPNDGMLFTTKAQLLYKMQRYTEAHEYIKKAIAIYPRNPVILQDFDTIKKALDGQAK
ncbi:MAG: tetratricopeptide repeat protein [Candidatus Omnitrophota bacterium]